MKTNIWIYGFCLVALKQVHQFFIYFFYFLEAEVICSFKLVSHLSAIIDFSFGETSTWVKKRLHPCVVDNWSNKIDAPVD